MISIFNDVVGPVMRGPSSSHCAAALRIGRLARELMDGDLREIRVEYACRIQDRTDAEFFKTFFNSLTRKVFNTVGVNPEVEFLASALEPTLNGSSSPIKNFPVDGDFAGTLPERDADLARLWATPGTPMGTPESANASPVALPDAGLMVSAQPLLAQGVRAVYQIHDAYLETPWFDAATGIATDRRPLGPEVVRVRAWIDPGKPNHSHLRVEVVYRPLADPSAPSRELDQQVPPDHPVTIRVGRSIETLRDRFGPRSPE